MSKQIFDLGDNYFAIGTAGKRALYVAAIKRGKVVGVRGQRPILDSRFKTTKANKLIRTMLVEAIA